MSIKSLFENIADAIKDKNPNVTNVTPVEMPSAIRDIPTGSSTAVGVTYDNTASGLTANNVQGAIDELAGNVSAITSDLSELGKLLYENNLPTGSTFVLPTHTYSLLICVVQDRTSGFLSLSTSGTGQCVMYSAQPFNADSNIRARVFVTNRTSATFDYVFGPGWSGNNEKLQIYGLR